MYEILAGNNSREQHTYWTAATLVRYPLSPSFVKKTCCCACLYGSYDTVRYGTKYGISRQVQHTIRNAAPGSIPTANLFWFVTYEILAGNDSWEQHTYWTAATKVRYPLSPSFVKKQKIMVTKIRSHTIFNTSLGSIYRLKSVFCQYREVWCGLL